jgi:hypothetical protein
MTKPTLEQIEQCDDEGQLNEWAAVYCMGWELVKDDSPSPFGIKDRPYWNNFNNLGDTGCYFDEWQPYHPTIEGKAQCFDLMVKFKLEPHFDKDWVLASRVGIRVANESLQTAIVKAALISAVSEDK